MKGGFVMGKYKVVHYINQFFGQIGGEEKADVPPQDRGGPVGPGMAFKMAFGEEAEIVGTVICGDSYYNEHQDEARADVLSRIKKYNPDLVIAGPAFNAGRYGMACGSVCKTVIDELSIPAVTGMFPENPGVEVFKKDVYIVETANSAAGMRDAVPKMAGLALKLARGEKIGLPAEEGYIPRGVRKNIFVGENGARRAVDMLVKKLKGEPFTTEYPMPNFDRVTPAPAVQDLSKATIALVTSGGIVPKGNPDRIEASSASRFGKYDLEGVEFLTSKDFQTAHGGYDPTYANENPNRVLPVDVMRDLEKEGVIGKLHRYYYATVGNGTSVASARRFAQTIAKELIADGVQAVILTST
jgi:glycine reductase